MRVALIGIGMVADMHVQAISDTGGAVTLAGICARDPAKATAFARRHGLPRSFETVDAVAEDPHIDAAILLTPPDARVDILRPLIAARKPVLIEKPIERDHARAARVVAMGQDAGVPLGAVLQHRMRPAAQTLIRRVADGALGQIGSVDLRLPWWRPQDYYDAPGRGTYARDGGGVLITQAIHALDLMQQVAGPVDSVTAMTATTPLHRMEAEDFAAAALRFVSGAVGSVMCSTTHFPGGSEVLTLNGTRASATLDAATMTIRYRDGTVETDGATGGTGGGADPMAFTADWHRAVIEDFAAAVGSGRPPAITAASALPAHALIDAIRMSAEDGRPVALSEVTGTAP